MKFITSIIAVCLITCIGHVHAADFTARMARQEGLTEQNYLLRLSLESELSKKRCDEYNKAIRHNDIKALSGVNDPRYVALSRDLDKLAQEIQGLEQAIAKIALTSTKQQLQASASTSSASSASPAAAPASSSAAAAAPALASAGDSKSHGSPTSPAPAPVTAPLKLAISSAAMHVSEQDEKQRQAEVEKYAATTSTANLKAFINNLSHTITLLKKNMHPTNKHYNGPILDQLLTDLAIFKAALARK